MPPCRLRKLRAGEEAAKAAAMALETRALALRQESARHVAGLLASNILCEESGTLPGASGVQVFVYRSHLLEQSGSIGPHARCNIDNRLLMP